MYRLLNYRYGRRSTGTGMVRVQLYGRTSTGTGTGTGTGTVRLQRDLRRGYDWVYTTVSVAGAIGTAGTSTGTAVPHSLAIELDCYVIFILKYIPVRLRGTACHSRVLSTLS
eukprot:SAG31_NODE_29835_length_389_cov_0.813793_1_plen_111_part_10